MEWLDTMREYSPQFKDMGISGQKAFSILQKSMDAGAWSLDKIADLLKEGHIRMQDMSKASVKAYEDMGLNAEKYSKRIAKGGTDGAKALQEVFVKLQSVKDETKRNELATTLFGTQYEDLREDIMWAMADGMKATVDLSNTTKEATKIAEEQFGQKWAGAMATLKQSFEPLGKVLLELLEKHMPAIQKAIQKLADKIANFDWKRFIDQVKEVANTVLPPLIEAFKVVWKFVSSLDEDTLKLIGTLGGIALIAGPLVSALGLIAGAFGLLASPIALAVAGLAAFAGGIFLLIDNWDKIKKFFGNLGDKIGDFGRKTSDALFGTNKVAEHAEKELKKSMESMVKTLEDTFPGILKKFTDAITFIANYKQGFFGATKSALLGVSDAVKDFRSGQLGKDIARGIAEGLKSGDASTALRNAAGVVKDNLLKNLKNRFEVKSPSRLMAREVGAYLPSGIALGVKQNLGALKEASNSMVNAVVPQVNGIHVPQSAVGGVYGGNQTNHNISQTVNVNATSPYEYAVATQRMLRRMKFQGGLT